MARSVLACLAFSWSVASAAPLATFGDWVVINADDGSGDVIAATGADSSAKDLLAFRCFVKEGKCLHVLSTSSTCEEGGEYPMLLNASSGASMIKGVCYKGTSKDELLLTPYESLENSIATGSGLLGIAIPMNSGAFRAVRFSLRGSKSAVEAATKLVESRMNRRSLQPGSQTF